MPQLAQGHLFGDQLGSAGLGLLALGGAKRRDYFLNIRGHDYLPPFLRPGQMSVETVIRPYARVEREEFRFELVANFDEPGHALRA